MNRILKTTALCLSVLMLAGSVHAAEFTMKISMADPETSPDEEQYARTPLREFARQVEEQSDGRIDVQIFWGGQLGRIENVLNLVRSGHVEAVIASDGHVAPYFQDVQVLGIPYLFIDRQIAYEVLDGPAGQALADRMADEAGIRPMPWLENGGYRHFSANRPLRSVEDMQGLKMRTMNNPVHMQIVRSLGASPTPVPWGDLYTSLQTGVVDGQENSLPTFRVPRLEEVQDHIILNGHVYSIIMLGISERWLDSLPDDLRTVIAEAAEAMQDRNRALSLINEQSDRAYLEGEGVTIFEPSIEERMRFQERTRAAAIDVLRESVSADLLDMMLDAVGEAEARL